MAIDVIVADYMVDASSQVEDAVRRAVREVGGVDLRVALLPSDRNGRWDLGLRDARGWSLTTFDASVEDLAARAATEVRQLCRASGRVA